MAKFPIAIMLLSLALIFGKVLVVSAFFLAIGVALGVAGLAEVIKDALRVTDEAD